MNEERKAKNEELERETWNVERRWFQIFDSPFGSPVGSAFCSAFGSAFSVQRFSPSSFVLRS